MATKRDKTLPLGDGFLIGGEMKSFSEVPVQSVDVSTQVLDRAIKKVAELEKRMNYKAKPLSGSEQDQLDTELRNFVRARKFFDHSQAPQVWAREDVRE